jgi:hypothetical protein
LDGAFFAGFQGARKTLHTVKHYTHNSHHTSPHITTHHHTSPPRKKKEKKRKKRGSGFVVKKARKNKESDSKMSIAVAAARRSSTRERTPNVTRVDLGEVQPRLSKKEEAVRAAAMAKLWAERAASADEALRESALNKKELLSAGLPDGGRAIVVYGDGWDEPFRKGIATLLVTDGGPIPSPRTTATSGR